MKRAAIILSVLIATTQVLPVRAVVNSEVLIVGQVVIHDADELQAADLTWTVERFAEVGLELPPLDVYVHDTNSGCDGYSGLYSPRRRSDRIDICTDHTSIILHEFAHAWEKRFATDSAREALLDEHELEAWSDRNVEYRKRGEEVAANLVAWGLIERPLTDVESRKNADTLAEFESLTGVPSPRTTP